MPTIPTEIPLRENSAPTVTYYYTTWRDTKTPDTAVDVSSYQITLIVKPSYRDPDTDALVADARALFTLNATSLGTDGAFSFVFTKAHSTFKAGTYPAEILFYSGGAPAAGTGPSDSWPVEFILVEGVDSTLP